MSSVRDFLTRQASRLTGQPPPPRRRTSSVGDLSGGSGNSIAGPADARAAEDTGSFSVVFNDMPWNNAQGFPSNFIKTSKYTFLTFLPLNLYEQFKRFANCYFLACIFIQIIPDVSPFPIYTTVIPLVVILATSAIKEAVEDYNRHKQDYIANNRTFGLVRSYKARSNSFTPRAQLGAGGGGEEEEGEENGGRDVQHTNGVNGRPTVLTVPGGATLASPSSVPAPEVELTRMRDADEIGPIDDSDMWLKPVTSKDILVGQLLKIRKNEEFPADIVLLSSSNSDATAFVNTANLDGEAVPKVRVCPQCTLHANTPDKLLKLAGRIKAEAPNPNLYQFQGRIELDPDNVDNNNTEAQLSPATLKQQQQQDEAAAAVQGSVIEMQEPAVPSSGSADGNAAPPLAQSALALGSSEIHINEQGEEIIVKTPRRKAKAANVDKSGRLLFPVGDQQLCLRGSRLVNTDYIYGCVIYTGYNTKMMLNRNAPRVKVSSFEQRLNYFVMAVFVFNFFICLLLSIVYAARDQRWSNYFNVAWNGGIGWLLNFLTQYILFSFMIPISLYVTIELVRVGQVFFMMWDKRMHHLDEHHEWKRMQVKSSSLNEELGCVQYVFSDKTGTLTQNKMELSAMSVNGNLYWERSAAELALEDAGKSPTSTSPVPHHPNTTSTNATLATENNDPRNKSGRSGSPGLVDHVMVSDLVALAMSKHVKQAAEKKFDDDGTNNIEEEFLFNILTCNSVLPSRQVPKKKRKGSLPPLPFKKAQELLRQQKSKHQQQAQARVQGTEELSRDVTSDADQLDSMEIETTDKDMTSPHNRQAEDLSPFDRKVKWLFQSMSPDETALCETCHRHGLTLTERKGNTLTILYHPKEQTSSLPPSASPSSSQPQTFSYTVMATLDFTSTRARMSVVVRTPDNQYRLYTKGADSAVYKLLSKETLVTNKETGEPVSLQAKTAQHVENFAGSGSRTLCYAMRILTQAEFNSWEKTYQQAVNALEDREALVELAFEEIEFDMRLLGCTGVEDQLQEYVPEAIDYIIKAGLKVIVLTGDKKETAVTISKQANLVQQHFTLFYMSGHNKDTAHESLRDTMKKWESMEQQIIEQSQPQSLFALAIDGLCMEICLKNFRQEFIQLFLACQTIVSYRSTPRQKALCVAMAKNDLKASVLAIGDGANDVSMIQEARVGIGILGKEGAHAAMSSDYVIHRFYHLIYLLFCQGRYNFYRTAKVCYFSFYKNMLFSFPQIYFSFYSLNSGETLYAAIFQSTFNLLFTSIPPLVTGWYEKDLPDTIVLNHPESYAAFQRETIFNFKQFFVWMAVSIYQGTVLYFFIHYAVMGHNDTQGDTLQDGHTMDLWLMGTEILFCVIFLSNIKFVTALDYITKYSILASIFGLFMFICVLLLFSLYYFYSFSPNSYQLLELLFTTNMTWAYIGVCLGVSYMPTLLIHAINSLYYPTTAQKLKVWYNRMEGKERAREDSVFVTQ